MYSTLHHTGNLLRDPSCKAARVSADTGGCKDGCLHLYLVIGLQTTVDTVEQTGIGDTYPPAQDWNTEIHGNLGCMGADHDHAL